MTNQSPSPAAAQATRLLRVVRMVRLAKVMRVLRLQRSIRRLREELAAPFSWALSQARERGVWETARLEAEEAHLPPPACDAAARARGRDRRGGDGRPR